MSTQKIMDVLREHGTFEQHPRKPLEAFEQLRGFSATDIENAFTEALSSKDENIVLFTLGLISSYFRECRAILPQVRRLAIEGSRLINGEAIDLLAIFRDQHPEVAERLKLIIQSDDEPMARLAARNLLLCYGSDEALNYLQDLGSEPVHREIYEWKYPIRSANESDSDSVNELLRLCNGSVSKQIAALRGIGGIEVESVATCDDQVVGHIVLVGLKIETSKPLEATLMLPVFVHPDHRRRQIGSRLVFEGLQHCEMLGKRVVFTYGQASFLSDFAFNTESDVLPQSVVPDWMSMELWKGALEGVTGKAILPELELCI